MKLHLVSSVALSAARLLSAVIAMKFAAVHLGVEGFALLGQFQSITAIAHLFGGTACLQAISAGTAQRSNQGRANWLATSLAVTFALSLAVFIVAALALSMGASYLGLEAHLVPALLCLLLLPTSTAFWALTSALGATERPLSYATTQVLTAAATVTLFVTLTPWLGLSGAMVAPFLGNLFGALLVAITLNKQIALPNLRSILVAARGTEARDLVMAGALLLIAGLAPPAAQLVVRTALLDEAPSAAGSLQAVWKVSEAYLLPLVIIIQIYFLPRFVRATAGGSDARRDFLLGSVGLVIALLSAAAALRFAGECLLVALLDRSFVDAAPLLSTQATADAFRTVGVLFGSWLIAQRRWKTYLAYEVGFWASFAALFLYVGQGENMASQVVTAYMSISLVFAGIGLFLAVVIRRSGS